MDERPIGQGGRWSLLRIEFGVEVETIKGFMVPLPSAYPLRLQNWAGLGFHGYAHSVLLFERQRLRQFHRLVFVDGFDGKAITRFTDGITNPKLL